MNGNPSTEVQTTLIVDTYFQFSIHADTGMDPSGRQRTAFIRTMQDLWWKWNIDLRLTWLWNRNWGCWLVDVVMKLELGALVGWRGYETRIGFPLSSTLIQCLGLEAWMHWDLEKVTTTAYPPPNCIITRISYRSGMFCADYKSANPRNRQHLSNNLWGVT